MVVGMSEERVRVAGTDDPDESDGRSRPPIWVVGVVVLSVVGAGWLLTLPSDGVESTPTVTAPDAAPETSLRYPLVSSEVPIQTAGFGPGDLAGVVALTSPLPFSVPASLWVLRPSGEIVRLPDVLIRGGSAKYPLLVTSELIAFANYGRGYLLDTDAAGPAEPLAPATLVIPGAKEGLVWFVRSRSLVGDVDGVAPVDVVAQTVGHEFNVSDLFSEVAAGVGDGLIVNPIDRETYGRFAYWSPSGGLAPLHLADPDRETVVSASGDLAVVSLGNRVSVFDVRNGST
jgi:hypothetical protein